MITFPRRSTTATLGLISALATASCGGGGDDAEADSTPVVAVRTAVVVARPFVETVGAIGTVIARPGHVASLGAPAPTRVARVYVAEGVRVTRGQLLVELDQASFQAAAGGAEAALTAAEQAYARAERLNREGVAPRKDVEQASAELARARSEAVATRRAAQLSVLRAPIAGVVTRLGAVLGASVDVNQPLVEVVDPSALDIILTVTPAEAARVRRGAPVTLAAGQRASGEALGTAAVADVAAAVDSVSRGVAVRVRAPGLRRPMRIGETVFGRIVVATHESALSVPLEALVPDGEGFRVFVVDSASVAHARPVTVGARADSTAEITTGLVAGERVVTYGAYGVDDGVKVTAARAPSAPAARVAGGDTTERQ